MRLRRTLALVAAAAAAALVPAGAQTQATALVGTVGTNDAYRIELVQATGIPVTRLDPGTYTILVRDRSTIHSFNLAGPGVSMRTGVEFVGEVTWTVTLTNGSYRFFCEVHPDTMHGSFTVGTPPAPKRLSASVGPGAKIALVDGSGARVTRLARGRYVVTVRDRTRLDNFHLRGPGVNRATGVAFAGRVRWTVTLRPGRYVYRSDAHRSLRGSFTVTS